MHIGQALDLVSRYDSLRNHARSCKYGTTCEITDKKGKGLPESGKGEALEIPHSPEKEPVSCLTDWH